MHAARQTEHIDKRAKRARGAGRWAIGRGMLLALLVTTLAGPGLAPGAASPARQGAAPDLSGMVVVPAGAFRMGATAAEAERARVLCEAAGLADCDAAFDDQQPARTVTTAAFYVDRTETTNADYGECVAARVCDPPRDLSSYAHAAYFDREFANYPVIHVTWDDARTYCAWRGKRLLTEAEWEKAARWDPDTGMVTLWPWGNDIDGPRLNLCDDECPFEAQFPVRDAFAEIAPVGSFPRGASPVGTFDMAGNVWEWVADTYAPDAYTAGDAADPSGPSEGEARVRRGGAWNSAAPFTMTTFRGHAAPDQHDYETGIRCGADVPGAPDPTPTLAPTRTPAPTPTPTPPPEGLYIGGRAIVNVVNDTLALRTGPGVDNARIEDLALGTLVTIVDGPIVSGGYTWWYIQSPSGNLGWAVDFADDIQTLVPLRPE